LEYNEAQRGFVKSRPAELKAREAERALDGPEAQSLAEAEAIGRNHIAEEVNGIPTPVAAGVDEDTITAGRRQHLTGRAAGHRLLTVSY
jgi:hypothetical protein